MLHPAAVLQSAQQAPRLPVVDHYCGTPQRMAKALALQVQLAAECGRTVMDVTLDCEDGAPVGGEAEHARMVCDLAVHHHHTTGLKAAARIHPCGHVAFESDIAALTPALAHLAHVMVPKVESVHDVARVAALIPAPLALHVLIESAYAVSQVQAIAAHPRVASISFGLMDFVSSHNGAIPAVAMTLDAEHGQFAHPLVVQAKLEISAACHAHAKVPSHCVVTEFKDPVTFAVAAKQAAQRLGYTRMWSIHPEQVRPLLAAFAPHSDDLATASALLPAAQAAHWAPISHHGVLHDRASYRYYWQVLQTANATGAVLPAAVAHYFSQAGA